MQCRTVGAPNMRCFSQGRLAQQRSVSVKRHAPALCPVAVEHSLARNPRAYSKPSGKENPTDVVRKVIDDVAGLGDGLGDLGPIGMTYSADKQPPKPQAKQQRKPAVSVDNQSGLALGPIGLSFGKEFGDTSSSETSYQGAGGEGADEQPCSIHGMTTEQWRATFEKDGTVDLWVEEEFNAGSRLVGGRAVHKGGVAGFRTGEGRSAGEAAVHTVKIFSHHQNKEFEVQVPEDRYILWEAEDKGMELPYACRMGCCTVCAVRIKEGEMYQPEALGISAELKQAGYGLMCVGFPSSDLVLETVSEDEVYDLQFGRYFATQALDPNNPDTIERDDFALSVANMDE